MDVASWLRGLGLGQYGQAFRDNDVDAGILPRLTADDLIAIGVTSVGHRRRLLDAIASLSATTNPAERDAWMPPVASERHVARVVEAERRQLTVMFVDLVGSTALACRLDPEDLREMIGSYHRCVADMVGQFGGYVAKYMGDGVLAYFGWPQAQEDEAERAVRAGLAIAVEVSRLIAPTGQALAVRVGLASGLAVVGDLVGEGTAQEQAVIGDVPNLAARLQALAEPGSVVIGVATRRQIGELFELESLGAQPLKGFDKPVEAWRVVRESAAESRFEALHGQRLTPLVGREHELGLLRDRFERAKDGEGQVVLLSGEPGIGKSRMLRALREQLHAEPCTFLNHFCSPFHMNSALYPIIGLFERAARFERDDSPENRLDKLEVLLGKATDNVREAAPLAAALLSLPTGGRYPPLNLAPDAQKQRTLAMLLDQLAGLATNQPVLAVYEDVHWADPSTKELLDWVVERAERLAILVVITFRSEFVSPWGSRGHITSLTLGRLGRRQGVSIIEAATGGKHLPAEVLDQIATKTDGVPLFIEELTRTLLESGLLHETADRYELTAPLPTLAIPPTLHDSLVARLDRLGQSKETAQLGAALGRQFSHDLLLAVSELGEVELHNALDQLERAGLIFRRGLVPNAIYSFKHALVRDAAYAGLLMSKRRRLHSRIARVLKEKFGDREPELLAFHFTEGGESAEAVNYWLLAGQRAAERSANVEAVTHLRHGLKLIERLPNTVQTARIELALQSGLGLPLIATVGYAAAETGAAYDRARELCDRVGSPSQSLPIMYGQGVFSLVHGEYRKGQSLFEELLRLAATEGEDGPILVARRMLGLSQLLRGDLIGARNAIDQALAAYEPARHRTLAYQYGADPQSAGLAWLALDLVVLGFPAQAEQAALQAIALAKETTHAITQAHALRIGGCYASAVRRDINEVHDRAAALKAYSIEHRMPYFRAEAEFFLAWSSAGERPSGNTISDMRAALVESGIGAEGPFLLALLAEAQGRQAQPAAGLSALDEALAALQNVGEFWWVADIHRLRGQLLLSLDANHAAAEGCYKKAIELAQRQSAKWLELRAARDLARLLHAQGRHDEARALLAPVYGQFTEGFELLDLREAKAMLDLLDKASSSLSVDNPAFR